MRNRGLQPKDVWWFVFRVLRARQIYVRTTGTGECPNEPYVDAYTRWYTKAPSIYNFLLYI
jgi:hypothetical protein